MKKTIRLIIPTLFVFLLTAIATVHAAPILKLHSAGHDVTLLQQLLQKENYTINITGVFDETTQEIVKTFQSDNNLPDTGIVDRQTWSLLTEKSSQGSATTPVVSTPTVVTPQNDNPITTVPISQPPATITIPTQTNPQSSDNTRRKKPQSEEAVIASIRAQRVPETTTFLPRSKVNSIISTAKKYMGTPYVYGGETPKGFDCSGYLQYVFKQNNIDIPRTADEQYKVGEKVPAAQLQPGDLVFFATDLTGISHCGIYLGKNQFIHASTSRGVRIDQLDDTYWQKYFINGKHIVK